MHNLPARRLGFADHLRNFRIVVVEYVVQQERSSFLRAEALEKHEKGERHLTRELELHFRGEKLFFDDGLGQPRSDVVQSFVLELAQAV